MAGTKVVYIYDHCIVPVNASMLYCQDTVNTTVHLFRQTRYLCNNKLHFIIVTPFEPIPDFAPRFNGFVTKVRNGYRVPPSSFPANGGPSHHGREIIWLRHFGSTRWIHAAVCVHSHDRDDALWQSSPTPAPLNYSRHAVESFTQSFSYINATQRDWSATRSVSRASSRPFRNGRGG